MNGKKTIHIISGGTFQHIATHTSIAAPAYGGTGRRLMNLCRLDIPELDVVMHETKMVFAPQKELPGVHYGSRLETNEDVANLVRNIREDLSAKIVFMPVALCDFKAHKIGGAMLEDNGEFWSNREFGKNAPRLKTASFDEEDPLALQLVPADKVITSVRRHPRKDIFLVGFKTTANATEQEMYLAGLNLLKAASCNLVLANDTRTGLNMIITPEEARYHVTKDRHVALKNLVEMAKLRSHLTFTNSTVVAGEPVPWSSDLVPAALREVVDYCIAKNAYKPFRGATVGHFAAKLSADTFLTSQRKTNFNDLEKIGLVRIKTDGPDTVLAYGAKPSVGGQSQRIVFSEHPEYDCIVHFHCPLKYSANQDDSDPECPVCGGCLIERDHARSSCNGPVPVVSQREYECGSHQCGQNTSRGLRRFGNLSAVYLDQHGPNIVFNSKIDPKEVIAFIEKHFDLSAKTGGYVS
jgi:hypothetical protein